GMSHACRHLALAEAALSVIAGLRSVEDAVTAVSSESYAARKATPVGAVVFPVVADFVAGRHAITTHLDAAIGRGLRGVSGLHPGVDRAVRRDSNGAAIFNFDPTLGAYRGPAPDAHNCPDPSNYAKNPSRAAHIRNSFPVHVYRTREDKVVYEIRIS